MTVQDIHKPKKHKCNFCRKKISLTMQELVCVCGKEFCLSHRLPESHDCTFNMREKHMESAQTQISAMKCVHEKINKI